MTSLNLKPLVKVVALVLTMITAGTGLFATEVNPSVVLKKGIEKSFALYMNYQTAKNFEVTLKDNSAKVLFNENVKEGKEFAKLFDLSKLPVGIYTLTIEDAQSIYNQLIEVGQNTLTIDENKESQIFKPAVYQRDEKVFVSALLLGAEDGEVVIFDKNGEVVYREEMGNKDKIEKVFSFAGKNPEDYSMAIRYRDQSFYFNSLQTLPTK